MMTTLDIDDSYRAYLARKGALYIDADGNEALVGLTICESVEYVTMTQSAKSGYLSDNLAELQSFLEVLNRHEAALPPSRWNAWTPNPEDIGRLNPLA
jgi:hypothetical protein